MSHAAIHNEGMPSMALFLREGCLLNLCRRLYSSKDMVRLRIGTGEQGAMADSPQEPEVLLVMAGMSTG